VLRLRTPTKRAEDATRESGSPILSSSILSSSILSSSILSSSILSSPILSSPILSSSILSSPILSSLISALDSRRSFQRGSLLGLATSPALDANRAAVPVRSHAEVAAVFRATALREAPRARTSLLPWSGSLEWKGRKAADLGGAAHEQSGRMQLRKAKTSNSSRKDWATSERRKKLPTTRNLDCGVQQSGGELCSPQRTSSSPCRRQKTGALREILIRSSVVPLRR